MSDMWKSEAQKADDARTALVNQQAAERKDRKATELAMGGPTVFKQQVQSAMRESRGEGHPMSRADAEKKVSDEFKEKTDRDKRIYDYLDRESKKEQDQKKEDTKKPEHPSFRPPTQKFDPEPVHVSPSSKTSTIDSANLPPVTPSAEAGAGGEGGGNFKYYVVINGVLFNQIFRCSGPPVKVV